MTTNNLLNSLKALAKVLETNDNPSNEELRCASQDGGTPGASGICAWVVRSAGVSTTDVVVLRRLIEEWPEGTGTGDFPIPPEFSTEGDFSPGEAFEYHGFYPFNPDQPYCQARRRLLNWLIEQLEGGS